MTDAAPETAEQPAPPAEVDPFLTQAAQQESDEADKALLRHLSSRVPLLRAELNKALERERRLQAEVDVLKEAIGIKQPQDRRPPAAKKTAAKKTAKKAATPKEKP